MEHRNLYKFNWHTLKFQKPSLPFKVILHGKIELASIRQEPEFEILPWPAIPIHILSSILAATLLTIFYEEPMRKYLKNKVISKSKTNWNKSIYRWNTLQITTLWFQINARRMFIDFQYHFHPDVFIWNHTFINLWNFQPKLCLFHEKKCFYKVF